MFNIQHVVFYLLTTGLLNSPILRHLLFLIGNDDIDRKKLGVIRIAILIIILLLRIASIVSYICNDKLPRTSIVV